MYTYYQAPCSPFDFIRGWTDNYYEMIDAFTGEVYALDKEWFKSDDFLFDGGEFLSYNGWLLRRRLPEELDDIPDSMRLSNYVPLCSMYGYRAAHGEDLDDITFAPGFMPRIVDDKICVEVLT